MEQQTSSVIVGDWPWPWGQPMYPTYPVAPVVIPYVAPQPCTHFHLTPVQRLSDEDVERIARRVAEILRGDKL